MRLASRHAKEEPLHVEAADGQPAGSDEADSSLELPTAAIPEVARAQAADAVADDAVMAVPATEDEPFDAADGVSEAPSSSPDSTQDMIAFLVDQPKDDEQEDEAAAPADEDVEAEPLAASEPGRSEEPAAEPMPEPTAGPSADVPDTTTEEFVAAVAVPQGVGIAYDVDEPTAAYGQFSSPPSPFAVLQQDEMSFYHDRDDEGRESGPSDVGRFVPGGQRRLQEGIEQRTGPPMLIVAGVAVAVMVAFCLALFRILGLSEAPTDSEEVQIAGTVVSKSEAEEVIASLDGWWKTDRALDGRFWHIEKKSVQTYAADGKLASENMLDETKVERMTTGPGGIDKPGYYLRDVGFYLADDDADTLYALAPDGSADADANLLRTEEPTFQEPEPVEEEEPEESEYVLPESATRVYEYDELDSLADYDLYLARNEIVARHGCIFKSGGELESYFTQKSWYQPNEYYSEYDLSDIEQQNLELIKSVEYNHGFPYQWS